MNKGNNMLSQLGLQGLASIGAIGSNTHQGMLNGYNSQQAQNQLAQQYNWAQQRIVVEPKFLYIFRACEIAIGSPSINSPLLPLFTKK